LNSFSKNKLLDSLKRHEGLSLAAYQDHLGYWTIGYGRLIDSRKNGGLSSDEAEYLLLNDINKCVASVQKALPWVTDLVDARQRVLYEMCFQLGLAGLLDFKRTLKSIEDSRWQDAFDGMLNSKWATQTPTRAKELAEMMLRG